MVFERSARQSKRMDEQWDKVKQGVRDNKLGFSAKITDENPGSRVMCIYTYSFLDEVDVWRVLDQLHAVGVYPSTWKADIMTLLGIYSSKAQGASCPHRPDLCIPGLNMGWFLPAHRPHQGLSLTTSSSSSSSSSFTTTGHGYNLCDAHGGAVKRTINQFSVSHYDPATAHEFANIVNESADSLMTVY
jgi:hypothetical protein